MKGHGSNNMLIQEPEVLSQAILILNTILPSYI